MRHPGGAEDLQLAKKRLDEVRRELTERDKKQKHQKPAENKTGQWRGNHRHNDFWPYAGVPFYDRPIAMRRG